MLQSRLDHMEIERQYRETTRIQSLAKNSYDDFNTIMMVAGIMIANNVAVLTAVDYGPSIFGAIFNAIGTSSTMCFFYVLVRAPVLIALAVHLGENGPTHAESGSSTRNAARLALRLFRRGYPMIFATFGSGLFLSALCFVLDVPPANEVLVWDTNVVAGALSVLVRGSIAAAFAARTGLDVRGDVHLFVDGLGDKCNPQRNHGYGWVWWFGPFGGPVDGGEPISARRALGRLKQLLAGNDDGPDRRWIRGGLDADVSALL